MVVSWTAYLLYFATSSTGHADTLPAQMEGFVRLILGVGTIAVVASLYITRRIEAIVGQKADQLRWCVLSLREELRRAEPYRVVGRAEVEATVPLVRVPAETARRQRPSKVRPIDEIDPTQFYPTDPADAFELGREVGRAERDKPES